MLRKQRANTTSILRSMRSLVVTHKDAQWSIALFQNTPAAFHGRPELSKQLTEELRHALRASPPK